jgi:3-oxoacyl-[acyl-carrier protein] reductase
MIDINNKWVLLTGASRGVGLRVAKGLAEKGCRLILQSRELKGTQRNAKTGRRVESQRD